MTQLAFSNNATTTLAVAINTTATTIVLAAGTGVVFPAISTGQNFLATIFPSAGSSPAAEVVLVTALSTDTLTVVRAQESTSAQSWGVGSQISQLITAGTMQRLLQTVTYPGNPNGNVAGVAATSTTSPSTVWDSTDGLLWICTTTGPASTAVWNAFAKRNGETGQNFNSATLTTVNAVATGYLQTAVITNPVSNNINLETSGSVVVLNLAASSYMPLLAGNGTSAQQVVNWSQFGYNAVTNGYQKLPSGIILQWGSAVASSNPSSISYNIAFPNAALVMGAIQTGTLGFNGIVAQVSGGNATFFYVATGTSGSSPTWASASVNWWAIGW